MVAAFAEPIRRWEATRSKSVILVFGKTGQVSRELALYKGVLCLGRQEANLLEPAECAEAIRRYSPSAVINAAAYTAVDKAEEEEDLASLVNGKAPEAMAKTCSALNIPFIHLSTDYVFDGSGELAWSPMDEQRPLNAYGRSKFLGEINIQRNSDIYAILRTSWVFSKFGNNFYNTIDRLSSEQSSLRIVTDQIGGPTPACDLAAACISIAKQLIADPSKSGIYHFCGWPNVSWAMFASEICKHLGRNNEIIGVKSKDYKFKATRPLNSRLNCESLKFKFGIDQPDWASRLR